MKPEIIKADIGYIIVLDEDEIYYVGGQTDNGMVYKSQKAFDEHSGICYVPEACFFDCENNRVSERMKKYAQKHHLNLICDDSGYTRDDFYAAAYEAIDTDDWIEQQEGIYGVPFVDGFIDHIAECIFQEVDWQCPETLLNEIDIEEDWNEYIKTRLK